MLRPQSHGPRRGHDMKRLTTFVATLGVLLAAPVVARGTGGGGETGGSRQRGEEAGRHPRLGGRREADADRPRRQDDDLQGPAREGRADPLLVEGLPLRGGRRSQGRRAREELEGQEGRGRAGDQRQQHRDRRRAAGRRLQGDQGAPEAEGPDQQGLRRPRQQAGRPVRCALDAALLRARPQGHAGLRGRPRRRSQGRQGRGGQAVRARRGRGRARGQGSGRQAEQALRLLDQAHQDV